MTRARRIALLFAGLAVALVGWCWVGKLPRAPLPALTPVQAALADELRDDVTTLATTIGERNAHRLEALRTTGDWLERDWVADGYQVAHQLVPAAGREPALENIEARQAGNISEVVVVGAHHDTVLGSAGANDNGSGVAAMRAIARRLAGKHFKRELRFVAFANEEYGFQTDRMGSRVYARRCRERNERVVAMLSLETMGCYLHEPGSQQYPAPLLGWLYPDRGDFVAVVGNLQSLGLAFDVSARLRRHSPVPTQWSALPEGVPGVGWSDHWAFWQEGFPAVMVTDTAPFRYVHYHTPQDTPDKLDYKSLARVVEGLVQVVTELAS